MFIIITGNPVDGFMHYGPYESREAAITAADSAAIDGDWWITGLASPETLPL